MMSGLEVVKSSSASNISTKPKEKKIVNKNIGRERIASGNNDNTTKSVESTRIKEKSFSTNQKVTSVSEEYNLESPQSKKKLFQDLLT